MKKLTFVLGLLLVLVIILLAPLTQAQESERKIGELEFTTNDVVPVHRIGLVYEVLPGEFVIKITESSSLPVGQRTELTNFKGLRVSVFDTLTNPSQPYEERWLSQGNYIYAILPWKVSYQDPQGQIVEGWLIAFYELRIDEQAVSLQDYFTYLPVNQDLLMGEAVSLSTAQRNQQVYQQVGFVETKYLRWVGKELEPKVEGPSTEDVQTLQDYPKSEDGDYFIVEASAADVRFGRDWQAWIKEVVKFFANKGNAVSEQEIVAQTEKTYGPITSMLGLGGLIVPKSEVLASLGYKPTTLAVPVKVAYAFTEKVEVDETGASASIYAELVVDSRGKVPAYQLICEGCPAKSRNQSGIYSHTWQENSIPQDVRLEAIEKAFVYYAVENMSFTWRSRTASVDVAFNMFEEQLRVLKAVQAASKYPWQFMLGMIFSESAFLYDPDCSRSLTSSAGAKGPMQTMPSTFKAYTHRPGAQICNYTSNVAAGTNYMIQLYLGAVLKADWIRRFSTASKRGVWNYDSVQAENVYTVTTEYIEPEWQNFLKKYGSVLSIQNMSFGQDAIPNGAPGVGWRVSGNRFHTKLKPNVWNEEHGGIDGQVSDGVLRATHDCRVLAAFDLLQSRQLAGEKWISGGTVICAAYDDQGNLWTTYYGHAVIDSWEQYGIEVGQKVNKGDPIAVMGSTGNSLGPHVHYRIEKNNQAVDPADFGVPE